MPRRSLRAALPFLVAGLGSLAGVLPARRAEALSPYLVVPDPSVAEASAAYRYANMTAAEALAELDKRKVPYKKADPISGVLAPVRLTGKLHGIYIHSSIPESQRATSVYEVLDARLALALDDFAKILSRHDIEEVVHYSLYRPNVPREDHDLKETKTAAHSHAAARSPGAESAGKSAPATHADAESDDSDAPAAAPHTGAPAKGGPAAHPAAAASGKHAATPKRSTAGVKKTGTAAKGTAAANRTIAKLPAPPAGKAFPAPPSKTGGSGGHGAKQKTPAAAKKSNATAELTEKTTAAAEKKTGAPAPARATKSGPTHAAGRTTPAATGRGLRPRSKTVANKGGAPAARPRGATAARGDSKASVPPKVGTHAGTTGAGAAAAKTGAKPGAHAPAAAKVAGTKAPAPKNGGGASKTAPASGAKSPATATAAAPAAPTQAKAHTHAPASRQTWAAPGTRHPAGLAIDVAMLKKRDGQWISVATHFRGRIGDKTCGDGVRTADTPEGRELRSIVCEANDLGVFTYVLTPNYNAAHYDHFHMEIRPTVKWFLYQ